MIFFIFKYFYRTEQSKLVPKQNVYSGGIAELIEQPEFQNVERMKIY